MHKTWYKQIDIPGVYRQVMEKIECDRGFLGRMYKNWVFCFIFVEDIENEILTSSDNKDEYDKENRLSQIIRERAAIAAYNALVKSPSIAGV